MHPASRTVIQTVPVSIERVFALLTDPGRMAEWLPGCAGTQSDKPLRKGVRFKVRFGERTVPIGALAAELRVGPEEIVAGLDDDGRYRPRHVALAVPGADLLEREADLRALMEWVRGPAPAAVVYGSRGMGKTALARAFVAGVRRPATWADVDAGDPEALRRALADSLRPFGGSGAPEDLERDLAAARPLIVLDGYGEVAEGVVDAVGSLFSVVAAAPGAKLLVLAQEATPSYCRFYGPREVRSGAVLELRLKGLSPEGTRRLLGNPRIGEEALRRVYLLTKGCPLYLTLIRDGDGARLREVSRFTPAEVRLLLFSRGATG